MVGAVGVALTAWWLVPFDLDQAYTTNMGWTNVEGFPHLLFPGSARWVLAVDLVGLVAMVVRRNRVSLFVAVMAGFSAAVVCLDPQGKLYNVRFLPLWFLCLYLFAGLAVAEVTAAVARLVRRRRMNRWVESVEESAGSALAGWRPGMRITRFRRPRPPTRPPAAIVGALLCLVGAVVAVVPPLVLPANDLAQVGVTVGADQPAAWATWNYSGYQEKPDYPEYKSLMQTMASIGADPGLWARHVGVRPVGEPLRHDHGVDAAALLDERLHRLDGGPAVRIGHDHPVPLPQPERALRHPVGRRWSACPMGASTYRSGSSTSSCLASATSWPRRRRYRRLWPTIPTPPWSPPTGRGARATTVSSLNTTWKIYRISDSSLVQPLTNQPVVWNHGRARTRPSGYRLRLTWYQNPIRWNVVPTAGGPATWPARFRTDTTPAAVPVPPATVSAISTDRNTVRFHVDRIGTPVEVKVSYFPNWKVSGADRSLADCPQHDGGGADQP